MRPNYEKNQFAIKLDYAKGKRKTKLQFTSLLSVLATMTKFSTVTTQHLWSFYIYINLEKFSAPHSLFPRH